MSAAQSAPPSVASSGTPSAVPSAHPSAIPTSPWAKRNWPSAGFFAIVVSYTTLVALIAWGWQKPQLEKAFGILNRSDLEDNVEYSPKEIRVLEQVWGRHPGFSRALLGKGSAKFIERTQPGGWLNRPSAHLAIKPEAGQPTRLTLEAQGKPSDFPIRIRLSGKGQERQVELASEDPMPLEWSTSDLKEPSILNVEVTANSNRPANTTSWAVRVTANTTGPAREAQ
ncbi:MAG TPA: hypothetical protein VKP30_05765 [Polyangiaceae bacterium]|nr:hypothetical protein [Polyangiaceae bacterium]